MNTRIKVCLIAPIAPPIGGIATWTEKLMEFNQNEVEFIYINTSLKKNSVKNNILYRIIYGVDIAYSTLKELKETLNRKKIDVVHITTSGSLGFLRDYCILKYARNKNLKVITHFHFGRAADIINKHGMEYFLMKKIIQLSNTVITIDKKSYYELSKLSNNVIDIPNPVNTQKNIEINVTNKRICYIGYIIASKGISELIKAWNSLSDIYQNWELMLIGPYNDEYYMHIKEEIKSNNIFILGEKTHKETMELLSSSSVLVLPSYTEGFPNVILEAMTYGKAIIATNVGAIPEMLEQNCGLLVKPKNVNDLISKMKLLMDDEIHRYELARNARRKVCNEFSIEKVFELYVEQWRR